MAVITLEKKELEKYIKVNDEMIEKSTMMGVPAEINDQQITLEITPNRPDLLSLQGFIRNYKAFIGKEEGLKKYNINKTEKGYKVKIDSSLKEIRPFTACAIVRGIKFDDSKIKEIIEMQEKLHATIGRNRKKLAIGIYPLEKITLPIKFEARKPTEIKFRPLEMSSELNGLQILQQHPAGKEYAHLLDGKEKYPVFVDANNKILSMPPIINSHETGKITENTEDVFIECSGFDFILLKKTINIVVSTLADMGGKIYSMELDYGKKELTPDFSPEKFKISLENTNKILGLNLKEKDLEKLLPKMGFEYKKGFVLAPSWRTDIMHEVDIIEDIAIAYGYDNILPNIPKVATIGEESKHAKFEKKLAEILTGLGLLEISSYHLVKNDEVKRYNKMEKIIIKESKTEFKILRSNLTIPALRIFSENKDNEYPQKIFEIGKIFEIDSKKKSDTGIEEKTHLLIACSPGNFTEIKQIFDYLMKMISKNYDIKEAKNEIMIDGRCGQILLDKKQIGYMGEIDPETLRLSGIKMPISLIEIEIEDLIR